MEPSSDYGATLRHNGDSQLPVVCSSQEEVWTAQGKNVLLSLEYNHNWCRVSHQQQELLAQVKKKIKGRNLTRWSMSYMESEERLLCLLHFRMDISSCRWTVSVSLSAGEKEIPGFGKSQDYTVLLQHISQPLCLPSVLKKGEGAGVLVMKDEWRCSASSSPPTSA